MQMVTLSDDTCLILPKGIFFKGYNNAFPKDKILQGCRCKMLLHESSDTNTLAIDYNCHTTK